MIQDIVSGLIPFMYWIRTNHETFFLDTLLKELDISPTGHNLDFFKRIIEYNHIAYTPEFDFSGKWHGRNTFCLNLNFAFTPTKLEVERKIVIQGSRFEPYITNLANAVVPKIKYRTKIIEPHLIALPFSAIKEYYYLYSNDELMEHLTSIEANEKRYTFPFEPKEDTYFYVPCFDMQQCYTDDMFGEDTKLLFEVEAFEHKIIRFVKKIDRKLSKIYIKDWEDEFKKFFFYATSTHQIDCTTIADLIANALFMGRHSALNTNFLLSPQEYLKKHNLLQDVRTGVKFSRWVKNVPFSPYNFWFHHVLSFKYLVFRLNGDENFFASIHSPITEGITYFFILEFVENNYLVACQDEIASKEACVNAFLSKFFHLEIYKPYHKKIASIVSRKYQKYAKSYNPFKKGVDIDVAIGILKVFKRVFCAISHLQRIGIGPKDVPLDISLIVQQMAQDIEYAARNIMNLMENKSLPDRDKTIEAIRDLTEKFEAIVDETERFVFSKYGRP